MVEASLHLGVIAFVAAVVAPDARSFAMGDQIPDRSLRDRGREPVRADERQGVEDLGSRERRPDVLNARRFTGAPGVGRALAVGALAPGQKLEPAIDGTRDLHVER